MMHAIDASSTQAGAVKAAKACSAGAKAGLFAKLMAMLGKHAQAESAQTEGGDLVGDRAAEAKPQTGDNTKATIQTSAKPKASAAAILRPQPKTARHSEHAVLAVAAGFGNTPAAQSKGKTDQIAISGKHAQTAAGKTRTDGLPVQSLPTKPARAEMPMPRLAAADGKPQGDVPVMQAAEAVPEAAAAVQPRAAKAASTLLHTATASSPQPRQPKNNKTGWPLILAPKVASRAHTSNARGPSKAEAPSPMAGMPAAEDRSEPVATAQPRQTAISGRLSTVDHVGELIVPTAENRDEDPPRRMRRTELRVTVKPADARKAFKAGMLPAGNEAVPSPTQKSDVAQVQVPAQVFKPQGPGVAENDAAAFSETALPGTTGGSAPHAVYGHGHEISSAVRVAAKPAATPSPGPWTPVTAMHEIARAAVHGRVCLELKLEPEHLGKIKVMLESGADKQIQMHMVVEQAASRQVIEQHLPLLRQALTQQGLDLGHFSMSTQHDQQQRQHQQSELSTARAFEANEHAQPNTAASSAPSVGDSRLSIRI